MAWRGGCRQQALGQSLPKQHGGFLVASEGSFLLIMSFICGIFFSFFGGGGGGGEIYIT